MPKLFIAVLLAGLLAGCATKAEFDDVAPAKVAVVIGYQVSAGKSLHPVVSTMVGTAASAVAGPGALYASFVLTDYAVDYVARPELGTVTMVEELKDAVYANIRDTLTGKGYDVTFVKAVPIEFDWWSTKDLAENYYSHTLAYYALGEQELDAIDADVVLYVEYYLGGYVQDEAELQSMAAVDLKVDMVARTTRAFSMPPENTMVFDQRFHKWPYFARFPFAYALEKVTDLESWPDKNP